MKRFQKFQKLQEFQSNDRAIFARYAESGKSVYLLSTWFQVNTIFTTDHDTHTIKLLTYRIFLPSNQYLIQSLARLSVSVLSWSRLFQDPIPGLSISPFQCEKSRPVLVSVPFNVQASVPFKFQVSPCSELCRQHKWSH